MRILLLTETLKWGGAELFTLRLANELRKIASSVVIFNFHKNLVSPTLLTEFNQLEIHHFNPSGDVLIRKLDRLFVLFKIDFSIRQIFLSRSIKKLVERYNVSVVHTHLFKVDFAFAQINRKLKLRHIITNHGDYQLFHQRLVKGLPLGTLNFNTKVQFVFNNVSSICCISQDQMEHIQTVYGLNLLSKLRLIYNGFEIKPFNTRKRFELGIPENSFVVGMVARGIVEKGWHYLVEAFKTLNRKNVHLILVGDGEFFTARKDDLAKIDNIHWVGYSSNPAEWISIFDIGVLPSYYEAESQPSVVFEYLAMGKPVICSNVGDVEVFLNVNTENRCGYTLQVNDQSPYIDALELKRYIDQYTEDENLLKSHSENARLRFEDFRMSKCVKLYWAEYA